MRRTDDHQRAIKAFIQSHTDIERLTHVAAEKVDQNAYLENDARDIDMTCSAKDSEAIDSVDEIKYLQ
jgi:hypothetical protein